MNNDNSEPKFKCKNVLLGKDFENHENFQSAIALHARKALSNMLRFAERKSHRVGVLFGLRRTGKTYLLYQWLNRFPKDRAACITVSPGEEFSDVLSDLDLLQKIGCKYVALDEITLCRDFVHGSAILSDKYASWGMKLFLTGTDSLSLSVVKNNGLFDRDVTLHVSHIPYAEWSALLNIDDLDEYLRWGGLLSLEPTEGEIENSAPLPWTENGRRSYFSSAVSSNIQNTLRNSAEGEKSDELSVFVAGANKEFDDVVYGSFSEACKSNFLNALDILSMEPESLFQAVLQSSLNDDDHIISQGLLAKKFRPGDLSRAKTNLVRKDPALANDVQKIIQTILPELEKTLHVQNRSDLRPGIDTLYAIETYLKQLDVYDIYPTRFLPPLDPSEKERKLYEKKNRDCRDVNLVCHPALRYGQADTLRTFFEEEMSVRQIPSEHRETILRMYDNTVLGIMLEDVLMHELMLACRKASGLSPDNKDWDKNMNIPILAAKYKILARNPGDSDKEIDIVVSDRRSEPVQYYLFEVKHSAIVSPVQRRWLLDEDFTRRIQGNSGKIMTKTILYMGEETTTDDGVNYCNAKEFLKMLYEDGLDDLLKHFAKVAPMTSQNTENQQKNESVENMDSGYAPDM